MQVATVAVVRYVGLSGYVGLAEGLWIYSLDHVVVTKELKI